MKKFLFFAAAMLALVACNKNNADEPNAPKKQIVLTATVNNNGSANGPHRVAPKDPTAETVHFTWEEGDQVYVMSTDQSETQVFTLVPGSISPDGETAQFEGTELSDMSSYMVLYLSSLDVIAGDYEVDYIEDSFKPEILGEGSGDNFAMNTFGAVLKFQLKGTAKLGKIEYVFQHGSFDNQYSTPDIATMNIAGGLQLTSAAKAVYFPIFGGDNYTAFKFYDTDGNLLDTKPKDHNFQEDMGSIITFPVLEFNAAPVLPAGALPGEFSVSATKKVHFSQGNLWADNSNVLHFEDAQWKSYDYSS